MQRKEIEWQQKLLDRIPEEYEEGNTRICVCAPCGAGKGFMMTNVADDAVAEGLRAVWAVNKDALIEGLLEKVTKSGRSLDDVAVIAGGYPKPDLSRPIWLCSIQTLARRSFWRELPEAYFVDIWMLDECHETAFSEVGSFICANPEKFPLVIGFTATPYRLSLRQSLSQRFEALLASPVPKKLTPEWLAPVRTFVMTDPGAAPDLTSVGTRGGDYIDADLAVACDKESLIQHAVDSWEKIAGTDKRSLVFGVNIEHASHLNDEFVRRGYSSILVTGNTPKPERREMYSDFQSGKLLVLCSVDVISVGFDCVEAEICLCCRPTKSKAKYYQIVGRVGRRSDHTGKQCGVVIDQAGNALRLGTPDTITEYVFDIITDKKKREGVNMKSCPDCGEVHLNFVRKCGCGYEFPSERLEQGGEMVEFDLSDRIKRLENKRLSSMQKWAKQAMAKGLAPGWATMKFKEAFGGWPDADLRLHAVYPSPTEDDAKSYLAYLAGVAVKRDHDRAWIHKEFEREFGTSFLMSDVVADDRLLRMMPILCGTNSVLSALRAG